MEVCNIGNQPTFVVANRSEVLDITLVSIDLFSRIREWKVLDKDMLSDHRPINFELSTTLKKVSIEMLGKPIGISITKDWLKNSIISMHKVISIHRHSN